MSSSTLLLLLIGAGALYYFTRESEAPTRYHREGSPASGQLTGSGSDMGQTREDPVNRGAAALREQNRREAEAKAAAKAVALGFGPGNAWAIF